jgi:hypothetical protein
MNMVKHITFRLVAGLILLVAIAGIAFFAYQAGANHAVVATTQPSTAGSAPSPYLYYGMPFGYFWGFPGFGFLGCLIPIFLFFLAFGVMRILILGPRWGWRHMHRGNMENGPWSKEVPSMFNEWHRRAHASNPDEQSPDKKSEQ